MCNSRLEILVTEEDSIREVEELLETQVEVIELNIDGDVEIDIDELAFEHGYIVVERYGTVILERA